MVGISILKKIQDIRFGDEFDCLYGRYTKRVRVISLPQPFHNHISLRIQPVHQQGIHCRVEFVDSAVLDVYLHRTPTRRSRLQQYDDGVYSLFSKHQNVPRRSLLEIAHWMDLEGQLPLPFSALRGACNRLAARGQFLKWHYKFLYYRPPLNFYLGMPLVEHPDSNRQRYGWVKEIKPLWSSHNQIKERPIIQWLDGTLGPSLDEWLDPVTDFHILKAIERDRQIRTGGLQEVPPHPIPWYLLVGLVSRSGMVRNHKLIPIAEFLGITNKQRLTPQERNNTLDYLDRYYPAWRQTYRELPVSVPISC